MAWKTMDVREQRVRFVVAAYRREKTLAELCREFGISRPVGYEWLKRYRQGGVAAIAEGSRRPQQDRKSTRLNSSHQIISYPGYCLKKKKGRHKQRMDSRGMTLRHCIGKASSW